MPPKTTALLASALAAGFLVGAPAPASAAGGGDAVVVAIIDDAFVPYHWDFLASKMPQARDGDPSNDLPLSSPPHTWLAGFPSPGRFETYQALDLSLDASNPKARSQALDERDAADWAAVTTSTRKQTHYYWLPGTKVIGALDFRGRKIHGTPSSHGTGTTSVAVGNLHGTCPECLLVFISADSAQTSEAALEWALAQPWIDLVSNSYGHSDLGYGKVYRGSNVKAQKRASERGQTIFFSAGNGVDNSFVIPNSTYASSQKGPDWLITVGAVAPGNGGAYVGAGKPVDVAGIGDSYPSAYTSPTVGGTGATGFSGTSNAAPVVAGYYGRALYLARRALSGPSRIQSQGVIARGGGLACGQARPGCELGDGRLTAAELRTRLLHGALHTQAGTADPFGFAAAPAIGEDEFMAEGHGTYFGRLEGDKRWHQEFARIWGPLTGRAKELTRPDGEAEWMVVDSYCRQRLWGGWGGGLYVEGRSELPAIDPAWPVRSSLQASCPLLPPLG